MIAKSPAHCAVTVLVLLLGTLPARAGKPLEGPEAPLFKSITRKLAAVSSYPLKGSLRVLYYTFKGQNEDLDGRFVEGVPTHLHQSPASGFGPKDTHNPGDAPVVTVTEYIFHYALDHDEAAFMIAHELSHLQLSHPEAYRIEFCRAYRTVAGQQAPCTETDAERDRLKQLAPHEFSRLDGIVRANETAADANALELVAAAGYDLRAAERLFRNMAELHRKYNFKLVATHPEPLDRLKALQRRIDQLAGAAGR